MSALKPVVFHLDLVSPYTWLALMQSERFAAEHGVSWELRPVVYAALLGGHGLLGPAEIPVKRRYTFHDVSRAADGLGLRMTGPPEHPFRSLEALRTLFLFREDSAAIRLAVRLSDACWGEGRPLTRIEVLEEVVAGCGLDSADLGERIAEQPNKNGLREMTARAFEEGIFGVPTFVFEGELFWGHDRLDHLAARLQGPKPEADKRARAMLERPTGVERNRSGSA